MAVDVSLAQIVNAWNVHVYVLGAPLCMAAQSGPNFLLRVPPSGWGLPRIAGDESQGP
jgi:hypothetical protein